MAAICYLVGPCAGGMEWHVKELINYFRSSHRIILVVSQGSRLAVDQDVKNGVEHTYVLPLNGNIAPANYIFCFRELVKVLHRHRPSLLHVHGYKAALCGCPAGRFTRVPVVVTVHNFPPYRMEGLALGTYFRMLDTPQKGYSQRFITVSRALAEYLGKEMGISAGKISVVHNGIDPGPFERAARDKTRYDLRKELLGALRSPVSGERAASGIPAGADTRLVGTVSRLAPRKGLEHFIRAAAILAPLDPAVCFLITGEGPILPSLREMVNELGLAGRVFFAGYQANIPAVLSPLDIFVLPSLSEGLSITLLEALAAAKPVVATRTGGIPEIMEQGTGILVAPGDTRGMAAAISGLLQNPKRAGELGKAGQNRVRRLFTRDMMFQQTESVYREVLDSV